MTTVGALYEAPSFEPLRNFENQIPEFLLTGCRPAYDIPYLNLGNPELPIYDFRQQIVDTVNKNQITMVDPLNI
jgi:hypothetical protein